MKILIKIVVIFTLIISIGCKKETPINNIVGTWKGTFDTEYYEDSVLINTSHFENLEWVFNNDQTGKLPSLFTTTDFIWIYQKESKKMQIWQEFENPNIGRTFSFKLTYEIIEDGLETQQWIREKSSTSIFDSTKQSLIVEEWTLTKK